MIIGVIVVFWMCRGWCAGLCRVRRIQRIRGRWSINGMITGPTSRELIQTPMQTYPCGDLLSSFTRLGCDLDFLSRVPPGFLCFSGLSESFFFECDLLGPSMPLFNLSVLDILLVGVSSDFAFAIAGDIGSENVLSIHEGVPSVFGGSAGDGAPNVCSTHEGARVGESIWGASTWYENGKHVKGKYQWETMSPIESQGDPHLWFVNVVSLHVDPQTQTRGEMRWWSPSSDHC